MSLILLFIVIALIGLLIAWGWFSCYVNHLVDTLFLNADGNNVTAKAATVLDTALQESNR